MKKNIFPRFYFVSNMALLDILSNSNNPLQNHAPHRGRVRRHRSATFALIAPEPPKKKVGDDDEPKKEKPPSEASSMVAKDGEDVPVRGPLHDGGRRGSVVERTHEVHAGHAALVPRPMLWSRLELGHGAAARGGPRPTTAQLALHHFADRVDRRDGKPHSMTGERDRRCGEEIFGRLNKGRLDALIKQVQGDLSKELRNKIITLITIDVHSRDIVQALIEKKSRGRAGLCVESQLRYYWDADGKGCGHPDM